MSKKEKEKGEENDHASLTLAQKIDISIAGSSRSIV